MVVVSGDFMGEWEETPKCWNWKSWTKQSLSVVLDRNTLYDDIINSLIEYKELSCDCKDTVISYLMNERKRLHLSVIKNDMQVVIYMLDIGVDGSTLF